MSHSKEKRREEIILKKKKTRKNKGYSFDIQKSKVKVLYCYSDMKDNKTHKKKKGN
jgi:hypothetical protein